MLLFTIQSSTFIFIFLIVLPDGCWNTLPLPLYWCVDFHPPCELPLLNFLLFLGSCWQNLQTATYILSRQSTLLPAGQPRSPQLTYIVHEVLHGETLSVCHRLRLKNSLAFLRGPTHSLLPIFFQSRKESIKSTILYIETFSDFLLS